MIALENYLGLKSESARLAAVKVRFLGGLLMVCLFYYSLTSCFLFIQEQILMRYLGLGIEENHHPLS